MIHEYHLLSFKENMDNISILAFIKNKKKKRNNKINFIKKKKSFKFYFIRSKI